MGSGVLCWPKVLNSGLPPRLLRPYSTGDKSPRLMMKATLNSQEHSKKLTHLQREETKKKMKKRIKEGIKKKKKRAIKPINPPVNENEY